MTKEFRKYITGIADEIIELSRLLDGELETWREVADRVPDTTSKGVSAGFVSKPVNTSNIEMVVDVQAPPAEHLARLRVWAIGISKDDNDNERFNNIQLTYDMDYDKARQLVDRTEALTREDFSELVRDPAVRLESVSISDQTGKDNATEELLGKNYDIGAEELLSMTQEGSDGLTSVLDAVVAHLKQEAAKVAQS